MDGANFLSLDIYCNLSIAEFYVCVETLFMDLFYRFEDLKSDSELFIEYLNRTAEIGSRWDNPTKNGITSSEIACTYFSQIDTKLMKKLQSKYKIDFILFKYDARKFEKCVPTKTMLNEHM